jgi:hypothetical protein
MSPGLVAFNLSIALLLVCAAPASTGDPIPNKPIWSKKGTTFPVGCDTPSFNACRFLRILSPNAKSVVEISYDKPTANYPGIAIAKIQVKTDGKLVGEVLPVGTVEPELVWSPDSKGFFINGNDNGYGDDHLAVHLLDAPNLGPGYISGEVEEDMVRSFPPCLAKGPPDNCAEIAADRDYFGMVGLDWIGDSSRMVVMAQVICSSSMGGIMCEVLGYELEVPSGKILRRMESKEFAKRWKRSMAWKFADPGPAEFETKPQPRQP